MASESQNPCMDGKFSWPSFSIHHYIMYWPLGWLTRILNHEITKWLDYCSDLMKQLVLNSWSSDWVRTFMNARLFLILFCVPAQKECKGLFLWPLLHFKSSIVYIHLMNTKLHAKPCRWISWRLYTMCILQCKLQAGRIYSEYWLMLNLSWGTAFHSYLLCIVLGHSSIHICAIRSIDDNAFCWISES